MNALPQPTPEYQRQPNPLHLVVEGEVSANWRRKAHTRQVRRLHDLTTTRSHAVLTSVVMVMVTAYATMISVFMTVPNTPLP